MSQRPLIPIILALLVMFGAAPGRAAGEQDAQHFVQQLAESAITTVATPNISDDERRERFRRLFVSAFDLPQIGQFVLGRYWRTATAAQRQQFLKEFEDAQVLLWSGHFKDYRGERLQTQAARQDGPGTWLVESRIFRPQQPPIPVRWRVHQAADGKLRIVDIIPQGASMAITVREDYSGALSSSGGTMDGFLASLQAKNQQLAAAPGTRAL